MSRPRGAPVTALATDLQAVEEDAAQIMSWDRFDPANLLTDAQVDEWIHTQRYEALET
jgi:hypothetical protein